MNGPIATLFQSAPSLPKRAGYATIRRAYGGYGVEVNTSGCGPEDRGFESHYSPLRLMVIHQPFL